MAGEMAERLVRAEEQIKAIIDGRGDRDREMKALKATLTEIDAKLDLLLEDKNKRDGVLGMGRWLIAIGIPSMVGGAVLWFRDTLSGHH